MSDATAAEPRGAMGPAAFPVPPLRIKHEDLPRKTLGYQPKAAADLFDEVSELYDRLWKDRQALGQRLERLGAELAQERASRGDASRDAGQQAALQEQHAAAQRALAEKLEKTHAAYVGSKEAENRLAQQVSELETELRVAHERLASTTDRLQQSEADLARFREQQHALADSIVWARHAATEVSEQAEREAARIVAEAERQAAELVSDGRREVERLASERDRLEALTGELQEDLSEFLVGTLERLKGEPVPSAEAPAGPEGRATAEPEKQVADTPTPES